MNEIEKYFRYRQGLIDQYVKGDMTKREYLEANYDAVIGSGIGPFKRIDSVQKGLFNYQYYNALAKHMKQRSTEAYLEWELKKEYQEKSNYYYRKKDTATAWVLRLLEYKNMTAYFVKVRSKALRGKLFEIILQDYQMILHSTNPALLETLREEEVFVPEHRESLNDGYINQRY